MRKVVFTLDCISALSSEPIAVCTRKLAPYASLRGFEPQKVAQLVYRDSKQCHHHPLGACLTTFISVFLAWEDLDEKHQNYWRNHTWKPLGQDLSEPEHLAS